MAKKVLKRRPGQNTPHGRITPMKRWFRNVMLLYLALTLSVPGWAWAQESAVNQRLNSGYDLLEKGQVSQARQVFMEVLQKDPGNPLALNNLAAVLVKEGKLEEALACLKEALPRARGYTVALNRVCSVEGVCAAFKASDQRFGSEDLEPVIKVNIVMVKMAAAQPRNRKR